MSRCFPFPPPGYENKARPDNDDELNSVVKKDKDKKHKDKKDKDKKERSERKDKERAKGKHKEDKDRKRKKHRDKKDKKRDKQNSSEEKKVSVSGPLENQNGEKPGPDDKPGDGANSFRILAEMGKRVKSDDGPTDKKKAKHVSSEEKEIVGPYVKKPGPDNSKAGNRDNGYKISVETGKVVQLDDVVTYKEKGIVRPSENQNSVKPGPDKKPGNGANGYRISVETGNKVRNDDGATDKKTEKKNVGPLDNQNGEKPGPDEKESDRILVEMGKRVRNNDGATDNSYHASMANGHSLVVDAKCSGNNSGEKRIKVENGSCQANMVGKKMEGREKNKNRDKGRNEDKKRKMEEKNDKVNEKSKEKVKQRANDINLLEFCANNPEDLLKESWDKQGKLPKLKEPVLNGVLHENGSRLDNMSRPAISTCHFGQNINGSHPSQRNTTIPLAVENQTLDTNSRINGNTNSRINGTKLASPQPVLKHVRETEPVLTANITTPEHVRARVDNHSFSNGLIPSHSFVENEIKTAGPDNTSKTVNGLKPILEGKKSISLRNQSASVKPKETVGTFIKPPHPDLKYLSQILTVPELESPLFDDDQEWLFGCKDAKRPNFGSAVVDTDRVWAEAIPLESVDVIALPYVIPY